MAAKERHAADRDAPRPHHPRAPSNPAQPHTAEPQSLRPCPGQVHRGQRTYSTQPRGRHQFRRLWTRRRQHRPVRPSPRGRSIVRIHADPAARVRGCHLLRVAVKAMFVAEPRVWRVGRQRAASNDHVLARGHRDLALQREDGLVPGRQGRCLPPSACEAITVDADAAGTGRRRGRHVGQSGDTDHRRHVGGGSDRSARHPPTPSNRAASRPAHP